MVIANVSEGKRANRFSNWWNLWTNVSKKLIEAQAQGTGERTQHRLCEIAANQQCGYTHSQKGELCSLQRNQHHGGSSLLITSCINRKIGEQQLQDAKTKYFSAWIFTQQKCHCVKVRTKATFSDWQPPRTNHPQTLSTRDSKGWPSARKGNVIYTQIKNHHIS